MWQKPFGTCNSILVSLSDVMQKNPLLDCKLPVTTLPPVQGHVKSFTYLLNVLELSLCFEISKNILTRSVTTCDHMEKDIEIWRNNTSGWE